MTKLNALLFAALFLSLNACAVGTVTASSRLEGVGTPAGLGPMGAANSSSSTEEAKATSISQRETGHAYETNNKARCRGRCDF